MFAALRLENEQLRQKVAEQDATITAINAKLSQLLALQQQPQPQRQRMPTPPLQPALPTPGAVVPQNDLSEDDDEMTESAAEPNPRDDKASAPTPKRRALGPAKRTKISYILARLDQHDERLTAVEARLTIIEQTCQAMQGNMQAMQATLLQILTFLSTCTDMPGNHDHTQQ
ncbi:hypothetical protein HPB48_022125 [Haemaphysalis longicornis]|uniref:Uncharacterized protein n=1 Tax=Haemaphysalis longicornis TaxID=44386 RepID=A0A9J6GDQ4_HAELO|nr:hypothetical protein HPB48_022125 [Haemaphysalis longicornis]